MASKTFAVLTSTDGGVSWEHHLGIEASNIDQACKKVRNQNEAFQNPETLFYGTKRFVPKRMAPKTVEKLGLEPVDLSASEPRPENPPVE